jgi:glycosyltransferase involved in cell wall biosynthesis
MKILTEYRIIKRQCPLWEERTQNIRYFPSWGSKLNQSPFVPRALKRIIQQVYDSPFIIALRLFRNRKDYDIIITGDFQAGIFYALLRKLFAKNSCPHLFLDLMLDAEGCTLVWRLKRRFQKKILASVDCMLVFSRNEVDYYSKVLNISPDRFRFVPYHTNITEPQIISTDEGYVFSAGKSGRDYKTLIDAVKDIPVNLVIVSDKASMRNIEIPANVKVYYDITYDNYLELLKKSKIVVVPLKPHIRSLGMVVMLEGMALGKPVIISRAISNVEYIKHGENGYLPEVGDSQAIKRYILHLVNNPKECEKIGKNALRDVKENWVYEKYVRMVLEIVQELLDEYQPILAKHYEGQPVH